jgi:hypothetical protein
MPARKNFRSRMVKLLYRVLSPRHPRGWIEIDWEEMPNGTLRLFSEGLDRFDLPEIEIVDCQADQTLLGFCHGMMFVAIAALHASKGMEKPICDGDTLDLRSDHEEDPALVRLHAMSESLLRLHDLDSSRGQFPCAAAAAYILNSAMKMRPIDALNAADLAAAIHAKEFDFKEIRPTENEFHLVLSQSNARAFYVAADALAALNRQDDAVNALKEAVARAPFMADEIRIDIARKSKLDWVDNLLLSVDPWEIQADFRRARRTI